MQKIDWITVREGKFKGRDLSAILYDSPRECAARHSEPDIRQKTPFDRLDWYDNQTPEQTVRFAQDGDMARVAPSDALLEKFEEISVETHRNRWSDCVAGAFPNIPAYIAGQPLAMRNRMRDLSAAAPLCVVVDLTTSAAIKADAIAKRGSALLAFVRLIAGSRPVELWAACGLDGRKPGKQIGAFYQLTRIETAPLDLARAAYVLTSAAYPRRLCYDIARNVAGYAGGWPFSEMETSADEMRNVIAPLLPHADEFLCLPPLQLGDALVQDPEAWLRAALTKYGPQIAGMEAA